MEKELALARETLDRGDRRAAEMHLLKVLRLDKSHNQARTLLRRSEVSSLVQAYEMKGDETAARVAGSVYGNIYMAPLVTALYPVLPQKGQQIWLPVVDERMVKAQFDYRKALLKARKLYNAKDYPSLLAAAEEILSFFPRDDEARYMKNSAAHQLAESFFKQDEYRKALMMYQRVDAYFKNEIPRIEEILALQKDQRNEVRYRLNEELMAEAKLLLKEGDLLKARERILSVEEGFSGRRKALGALGVKMVRVAERHYRRGVTLFLEEKLAEAIAAWEICLRYQPDHQKALEAAENARRLLEKVQGMKSNGKGEAP